MKIPGAKIPIKCKFLEPKFPQKNSKLRIYKKKKKKKKKKNEKCQKNSRGKNFEKKNSRARNSQRKNSRKLKITPEKILAPKNIGF